MKTLVLRILAEVNSVDGPPQGRWTFPDWEALPDDGNNYEVIGRLPDLPVVIGRLFEGAPDTTL